MGLCLGFRGIIIKLGDPPEFSSAVPSGGPSAAEMANEPPASRPWIIMAAPYLVCLLIAAHVFALVYWIYRLASEKQPQRRKARRIE